jgi:hypothetical protein
LFGLDVLAGNCVVLLPFCFLNGNTSFFFVPCTGAGFPGLLATLAGVLVLFNGFIIVATAVFLPFQEKLMLPHLLCCNKVLASLALPELLVLLPP